MSYIVKKTNGSILVEVPDETVNVTASSVALVGHGAMTYGVAFAENFVHLTENFAHSVAPGAPLKGQLWFDTGSNAIKVYNGTGWHAVGASLVNPDSPESTAGSVGVALPTGDGEVTAVAFLSGGKIVALVSQIAVASAKLPATVLINNASYTVKERFPTGLKPGITFARTTTDSYMLDGSTKWGAERIVGFTGDVDGAGSMDGSGNETFTLRLANTGVVPGTYTRVTVDAKGRVTGATSTTITLSGDASGTLDPTSAIGLLPVTLTTTGVTPGAYGGDAVVPTFRVDEKGRVTQVADTPIRVGTTSQTGIVQLSSAVTSTSTSLAATPKAVKQAYDLAAAALPATGGTVTGNLTVTGDLFVTGTSTGGSSGAAIPTGLITLWYGAVNAIPTGWALCDGQTVARADGTGTIATPDLRDRFVIGAGSGYAVGATGGANAVTLTAAHLPAHTHTFSATTDGAGAHDHAGTTASGGAHTHDFDNVTSRSAVTGVSTVGSSSSTGFLGTGTGTTITTESAGAHTHTFTTDTEAAHTHTVSGTTSSVGSGTAIDSRPPYYALCYIMRL